MLEDLKHFSGHTIYAKIWKQRRPYTVFNEHLLMRKIASTLRIIYHMIRFILSQVANPFVPKGTILGYITIEKLNFNSDIQAIFHL